jgi:hypothetical protein
VADVEYESCAEELRLCGSEPTLIRPSDMRTLVIDLPSPLPLSRLGVLGLKALSIESFDDLDFRELRGFSLASGLGGKLPPREISVRGGCGNELMLTVLRIVLGAGVWGAGLLAPPRLLGCGSAEVGAGEGGPRPMEGARNELWGSPEAALKELVVGMPPVLLRVFVTGNAGSAIFGGPIDGRDGRGKAVVSAMMLTSHVGYRFLWVLECQSVARAHTFGARFRR